MRFKMMFLPLLFISCAGLASETIHITGRIDEADCAGATAVPAPSAPKGMCVVTFSGVSDPITAPDGSSSTTTYEGALGLMSQGFDPVHLVGKRVYLTVDLNSGEILACGQRN